MPRVTVITMISVTESISTLGLKTKRLRTIWMNGDGSKERVRIDAKIIEMQAILMDH